MLFKESIAHWPCPALTDHQLTMFCIAGKLGHSGAALSCLRGPDLEAVPAIVARLKAKEQLTGEQQALLDKGAKLLGAWAWWVLAGHACGWGICSCMKHLCILSGPVCCRLTSWCPASPGHPTIGM